jgi:Family of unknown function (DUF6527)
MKERTILTHEFVEFIPDDLNDGVIYVSIPYATVAHKCCCGCGQEVITPLSPTDWKLTFDGKTISLHPSIGNWSFACQSHYWIRSNHVSWAPRWTKEEIDVGRSVDRSVKKQYFDDVKAATDGGVNNEEGAAKASKVESGWWQRLIRWWQGS